MSVDIVAHHESAHAAAGALVGLPITGLVVGPSGGMMTGVRPSETPADLRKELVATLAPAVELGIAPAWPPNPYASQDERDAYVLAASLGLDEQGYRQAVIETHVLTQRPQFKRLRSAIERAALAHGSLDQRSLERLIEASTAAHKPRPERKMMSRAARLADIERRLRAQELAFAAEEQSADLDELERQLKAVDQDRKARAIALEFKDL